MRGFNSPVVFFRNKFIITDYSTKRVLNDAVCTAEKITAHNLRRVTYVNSRHPISRSFLNDSPNSKGPNEFIRKYRVKSTVSDKNTRTLLRKYRPITILLNTNPFIPSFPRFYANLNTPPLRFNVRS